MTLVERDGLHPVHAIATDTGELPSAALDPESFHHNAPYHDAHGFASSLDLVLPVNNMGEAAHCPYGHASRELFGYRNEFHKRNLVRLVGGSHRTSPYLESLIGTNVPHSEKIQNTFSLHGRVKFATSGLADVRSHTLTGGAL
jgi:hypothetical protein